MVVVKRVLRPVNAAHVAFVARRRPQLREVVELLRVDLGQPHRSPALDQVLRRRRRGTARVRPAGKGGDQRRVLELGAGEDAERSHVGGLRCAGSLATPCRSILARAPARRRARAMGRRPSRPWPATGRRKRYGACLTWRLLPVTWTCYFVT